MLGLGVVRREGSGVLWLQMKLEIYEWYTIANLLTFMTAQALDLVTKLKSKNIQLNVARHFVTQQAQSKKENKSKRSRNLYKHTKGYCNNPKNLRTDRPFANNVDTDQVNNAVHAAIVSMGSRMDYFKFLDKYGKQIRCSNN